MQEMNQFKDYQSISPNDIKGTGDTYKTMILMQIGRVTYLLTLGSARYEGKEQMFTTETLARSALRGIQILEAMITPIMKDDYETTTRPLKESILKVIRNVSNNELEFYDYYTQWLTVIIQHLHKLNMLPDESTEIEFD